MAETVFRGPTVSAGALMDNSVGPFDGPSISYQGKSIPDVRYSPILKDGLAPGRVLSFMDSVDVVLVDNFISAATITAIAQNISPGTTTIPTGGISVTLNATTIAGVADSSPAWTTGLPIIPFGSNTVTTVNAIDFGFTTGTTVANSSTVVVVDSTLFDLGQWIVIGGAGISTNKSALITQISGITNATTITVSPVALGAISKGGIGQANLFSQLLPPPTQFGPAAVTPNAAIPYQVGGLAAIFDPAQGVARALSVSGSTTVATASFLFTGFDIFGQAMSELISSTNGTTNFGKKAFKYVRSSVITALNTTNGTFSVGVSDTVGVNLRNDKWEYSYASWKGASVTNNNGWTAAFTGPATATTGDVRGTFQISTSGPLATSIVAPLSNGTSRFWLSLSVPNFNMLNADTNTSVSLFGQTQA